MSDFAQVAPGIHIFRFQGDVSPDGSQIDIQFCFDKAIYGVKDGQPDYRNLIAKIPNTVRIINVPSLEELEQEFPGTLDLIRQLQVIGINYVLKRIAEEEAQLIPQDINNNDQPTTSEPNPGSNTSP